jgi:undecaprenyl pyrophosphate phosphatase UppP
MKPSKFLIGLETTIASIAAVMGIITIFWRDWIEALTGWDPDHHNGSFEWIIVAVLLVIAATAGLLARHHRRLVSVRRASSQPIS